eukprot:3902208-Rhodomonas_salina.3
MSSQLPTGRGSFGLASSGAMLYMFAGVGSLVSSELSSFDTVSQSWTDLSVPASGPGSAPPTFMAMAAFDEKIWVLGYEEAPGSVALLSRSFASTGSSQALPCVLLCVLVGSSLNEGGGSGAARRGRCID